MKKINDEDLPKHFWSKVKVLGNRDCWEWQAGFYTNGYGRFYLHRKATPAHRVSFMYAHGFIDEKLEVCHECDNKKCVNPNHLFQGTHKENMYDAIGKGLIKNPPIAYGEDNTSSKLNEVSVRTIFRLHGLGWTKASLGRKFGVTRQAIHLILKRVNWAWVEL